MYYYKLDLIGLARLSVRICGLLRCKMTLTNKQYEDLAGRALDYVDAGVSTISIPVCGGNDAFIVWFEIRTDGYDEDDYYNGTGGHVTTCAVCRVSDYSRSVIVSDDDVERVEFDTDRFERMVEKELIT